MEIIFGIEIGYVSPAERGRGAGIFKSAFPVLSAFAIIMVFWIYSSFLKNCEFICKDDYNTLNGDSQWRKGLPKPNGTSCRQRKAPNSGLSGAILQEYSQLPAAGNLYFH